MQATSNSTWPTLPATTQFRSRQSASCRRQAIPNPANALKQNRKTRGRYGIAGQLESIKRPRPGSGQPAHNGPASIPVSITCRWLSSPTFRYYQTAKTNRGAGAGRLLALLHHVQQGHDCGGFCQAHHPTQHGKDQVKRPGRAGPRIDRARPRVNQIDAPAR